MQQQKNNEQRAEKLEQSVINYNIAIFTVLKEIKGNFKRSAGNKKPWNL